MLYAAFVSIGVVSTLFRRDMRVSRLSMHLPVGEAVIPKCDVVDLLVQKPLAHQPAHLWPQPLLRHDITVAKMSTIWPAENSSTGAK